MPEPPEHGSLRRSDPSWSIVQVDDVLHVDLGEGVGTADLERILDALGTFSQGFTVGKEIVFDLPKAPLSNVAAAFLSVVADTIRRNGMGVRIDPEPK